LVNPNTKATSHVGLVGISHGLRLTMVFRFPNATTEFVTQIAFSPTRNLLAWTDFAGSLYRWSDPIPSSSPSPVTSVSTSALTRPIRRGPTPTLFDDDAIAHKSNPQGNKDIDLGGTDDFENEDWILDDVGDGMVDNVGAHGDDSGEFVKEMGMGIHFTALKYVLTSFTVSVTKAQPAFQPGSSPMENRKRYLGTSN
jgi:chromosome transmission fidelity protein 4